MSEEEDAAVGGAAQGEPPCRRRLRRLTRLLFLLGGGLLLFPFLAYLFTPEPARDPGENPWQPVVELGGLKPGELREVDWPGGRVAIYRRTAAQLARLHALDRDLRDPRSAHSRQPGAVDPELRSLRPEYFVFHPVDPLRGCRVRLQPSGEGPGGVPWLGGFREPCGGAWFDPAGRVYAGQGAPGETNLAVPPYRFIDRQRIQLGVKP